MLPRAGASLAFAAFVFANLRSPASASGCSSDSFAVDGVALSVELCDLRTPALPAHGKVAAPSGGEVREILTVNGRPPLVRGVRYDRLANEETSRTLDDIPLQSLGIGRTMHVTLAVHDGSARLEHALLVPGAVPLK